MSQIEPCARCGKTPIVEFRRFHTESGSYTGYVVHCVHCQGTFPHATEAEAIAEWDAKQRAKKGTAGSP